MLDKSILDVNLNNQVTYDDYFAAFGYGLKDMIFFRTFNDKKAKGEKDYGKNYSQYMNDLNGILQHLHERNKENHGVFYVVNGGGQKDKDVKKARAQFIDIDDCGFDEQIDRINNFPLEPSIIVKTKKSLHTYWLLAPESCDVPKFKELQQRLIQQFKSDKTIKNPSRVMRLYGFEHRKADPVMVTLIKFDPDLKYTQEQLHEVLPKLEKKNQQRKSKEEIDLSETDTSASGYKVKKGERRNYLYNAALAALTAYGITKKALDEYKAAIKRCDPDGMENSCLQQLWTDAQTYYRETIATDPAYLPPVNEAKTYEPADYTDVGQAQVYLTEYGNVTRYSSATGFIVFNGKKWEESPEKAQGLSQELTTKQLSEAKARLKRAGEYYNAVAETGDEEKLKEAKKVYAAAKGYQTFVLSRRKVPNIKNTLTAAIPYSLVDVRELDKDPFLLNTPAGTVDLRTGDIKKHDPRDFCTKITGCSPGDKGAETFNQFLDQITCGDEELKSFLQVIAGMCAIGCVKAEYLVIAYGEGGNGKSTMFNLWKKVLYEYAWTISTDVLVKRKNRNIEPDKAELRGKRIVTAKETDEGEELNASMVKDLCSIDDITGAKKFKDSFNFTPSHTLILFTNHLPKVDSTDNGIWDRLLPIPFNGRFRNTSGEIKDYADVLLNECGEAVLTWIIEGAKKFIADGYKIALPDCVQTAIEEYRTDNDWVINFINDCCDTDQTYKESSGALYEVYGMYCDSIGTKKRSPKAFKTALMNRGYLWSKTNKGKCHYGLKLKEEYRKNRVSPQKVTGGDG